MTPLLHDASLPMHGRRLLSLFAAVALVMAMGPGQAQASSLAPSVLMIVDGGDPIFVDVSPNRDGKTYYIGLDPEGGWSLETNEFFVQLHGELDPDPSINYGLTVQDYGAPTNFHFIFSLPIVPTGSPNTVQAGITGSLQDVTGDGISLTPTNALIQTNTVDAPSTNMGVDVGPGASHGSAAPNSLYTYGPFVTPLIAGPGPGPWTLLTVDVHFTLSGRSDIAQLTGFASISTQGTGNVPEPGTVVLSALGFAGLGAYVLRRRRSA